MTELTTLQRRVVPPMSPGGSNRQTAYGAASDEIIALIESRGLKPGDALPSEAELGQILNRSRAVVRSAILNLIQHGIVDRRNGKGSFIAKRDVIVIDGSRMQDLDDREQAAQQTDDALGSAIAEAGHEPHAEFSLLMVAASQEPGIAQLLHLGPESGIVVRKVERSVNGNPRMIETGFFSPAVAGTEGLERIGQPFNIHEGTTVLLSSVFPELEHNHLVGARYPTPSENNFLKLAGVGVLVQTIVTQDRPGGDVIRVIRTVYRADRYTLRFFVPGRGCPPMPAEIVELDGAL
jgi:DNA-binding GntR family transcriptional regulator